MALGLHRNCQTRLYEKVAEALAEIKVSNRIFLDRFSIWRLLLAEAVLPGGKTRTTIEKYVNEMPLVDFVYGTLSRELHEFEDYETDGPVRELVTFAPYRDMNAVAARLVAEFESLPWEYRVTTQLSNDFSALFAKSIKEFSLSDSVRLITPTDKTIEEFPLQSGIEKRDREISGTSLAVLMLGLPKAEEYNQASTYLQVKVTGFIGKYVDTQPVQDALSALKAFFGLALAVRLLRVESKFRPSPAKVKSYIHRRTGNAWVIEGLSQLDSLPSETPSDLVIHNLDGKIDNDEKKIGWMNHCLPVISLAFSNPERAQKILLAAQWLFDSHCGRNELLSFIQCTVVMEILLGDKAVTDVLGLGQLLRNRCAYLIGDSAKQRDEILSDFGKIYDVRSKIVHSGKSRLNYEESALFRKLQWMCRRVIQEELDLLKKDKAG